MSQRRNTTNAIAMLLLVATHCLSAPVSYKSDLLVPPFERELDENDTPNSKEKSSLHQINEQYKDQAMQPPKSFARPCFLSATIMMTMNPVETIMKSDIQAVYEKAFLLFLQRVFRGQRVYDVNVLSISVISQDIQVTKSQDRRLSMPPNKGGGSTHSLSVETVIASQFTPKGDQNLSKDDFNAILLHVCGKFEQHLLTYLRTEEDDRLGTAEDEILYFGVVHSIKADFYKKLSPSNVPTDSIFETFSVKASTKNNDMSLREKLGLAGVVGLVVGVALFGAIVYKTGQDKSLDMSGFYSPEQRSFKRRKIVATSQSERNLRDIGQSDIAAFSANPYDDIKLSPTFPTTNTAQKLLNSIPKKGKTKKNNVLENKIASSDMLKERQTTSPNMHYPAPLSRRSQSLGGEGTSGAEPAFVSLKDLATNLNEPAFSSNMHDNDQEKSKLLEKNNRFFTSECHAPPGKLGIAIDTINGEPVVHRIKSGSPLDGVLRRLDRIVAIDDVDTTSMSAADVTYLMVKRMNHERKITFVRGDVGQSLLDAL